jgi:hypothetical protein
VTRRLVLLRSDLSFLNCAEHGVGNCGRPACPETKAMEFVNFVDSSRLIARFQIKWKLHTTIADKCATKMDHETETNMLLSRTCTSKNVDICRTFGSF